MERNPLVRAVTAAAAVLVLLGGCTSDSATESSTSQRDTTTTSVGGTPVPDTVTTSTTARPASVTSTTGRVTTTTTRAAGQPRVTASPPAAAPEARVNISGEGFTAENWRTPNVPLWLAGGTSGCDFFAEADHQVEVSTGGRLTGWFVVPSYGTCRQSATGDQPVTAGRYRIVYQCTACTIGEFEVTASAPPATARCQDVGFTPNSDDLAADIVADGLSCAEAEAVVRRVGEPLGPLNGAAQGEADGFTCRRTSQTEGRGLPVATFECTRGSQRITFERT